MQRQLSERHPLFKLLSPHFWGTHMINAIGGTTLVENTGVVDIMMAPSVQETIPMITETVKEVSRVQREGWARSH